MNEAAPLASTAEQQLAAIGGNELQAAEAAGKVRYRQRQRALV
jgi:hypothetical protein